MSVDHDWSWRNGFPALQPYLYLHIVVAITRESVNTDHNLWYFYTDILVDWLIIQITAQRDIRL